MTNEELAVLIKAGQKENIPQLWEQLRGLICQYARRYCNRLSDRCASAGATVDDLCQEGYFALLDAVAAWEPESGHKLSTYLKFPIQNRFNALVGFRTAKGRAEPLNHARGLDEPMPDAEDITLADSIPDPEAVERFKDIERVEYLAALRQDMAAALEAIPAEKADALRMQYYQRLSLAQAAQAEGVPPEVIRHRRASGMRAICRPEAFRHLEKYRRDVVDRYAYHGSVGLFRQTWTSTTERAALIMTESRR